MHLDASLCVGRRLVATAAILFTGLHLDASLCVGRRLVATAAALLARGQAGGEGDAGAWRRRRQLCGARVRARRRSRPAGRAVTPPQLPRHAAPSAADEVAAVGGDARRAALAQRNRRVGRRVAQAERQRPSHRQGLEAPAIHACRRGVGRRGAREAGGGARPGEGRTAVPGAIHCASAGASPPDRAPGPNRQHGGPGPVCEPRLQGVGRGRAHRRRPHRGDRGARDHASRCPRICRGFADCAGRPRSARRRGSLSQAQRRAVRDVELAARAGGRAARARDGAGGRLAAVRAGSRRDSGGGPTGAGGAAVAWAACEGARACAEDGGRILRVRRRPGRGPIRQRHPQRRAEAHRQVHRRRVETMAGARNFSSDATLAPARGHGGGAARRVGTVRRRRNASGTADWLLRAAARRRQVHGRAERRRLQSRRRGGGSCLRCSHAEWGRQSAPAAAVRRRIGAD